MDLSIEDIKDYVDAFKYGATRMRVAALTGAWVRPYRRSGCALCSRVTNRMTP